MTGDYYINSLRFVNNKKTFMIEYFLNRAKVVENFKINEEISNVESLWDKIQQSCKDNELS